MSLLYFSPSNVIIRFGLKKFWDFYKKHKQSDDHTGFNEQPKSSWISCFCWPPLFSLLTLLQWCKHLLQNVSVHSDITAGRGYRCKRARGWLHPASWSDVQNTWNFKPGSATNWKSLTYITVYCNFLFMFHILYFSCAVRGDFWHCSCPHFQFYSQT